MLQQAVVQTVLNHYFCQLASHTLFCHLSSVQLTFVGDMLVDMILENLEPTLLLRRDSIAECLLGTPEHFRGKERLFRRILDVESGANQILLMRVARPGLVMESNRSPKGDMWSAIPVALLCILVIVGDGQRGSGLKGDNVL